MKDFIKSYKNPNENRINFSLLNRENDEDLIEYLVKCCKSLEVLKYIKFLGYEYTEDETKIDINDYMSTRKKSKKNVNAIRLGLYF
jgi:predicted RNA-binding protein Jag